MTSIINNQTETTITAEVRPYSMQYAYDCLPKNKLAEFRNKIKVIIKTTTENSVYDRITGRIEPKISEAKAFELLFKSYGIKLEWGRAI